VNLILPEFALGRRGESYPWDESGEVAPGEIDGAGCNDPASYF
jgi:hypothetical protein